MEKFEQLKIENSTEDKSFQDQLIAAWEKIKPEGLEVELSDQQALKNNVSQREDLINDHDLEDLLAEYGLDWRKLSIRKIDDELYALPVQNNFNDQALPEGYAYKGGAARCLLARNLGIDPTAEPRDIDIVRLATEEPQENLDQDLAKKYMPADFEHGFGVEVINDKSEYFVSRDFTINEVLATDKEIFATKQCLLDNTRHIIRATDYEWGKYEGNLCQKMMSKALRFYAENIIRFDDAKLANEQDYNFESYFISPFWLAVQLDRAFEKNRDSASEFVSLLKDRRQIPTEIDTPEEAAAYLLNLMKDSGNFYYRHAPNEQFNKEKSWLENYQAKLDRQ